MKNGELIRTLVDKEESAGYRAILWNGIDDLGKRVPFSGGNKEGVDKSLYLVNLSQ